MTIYSDIFSASENPAVATKFTENSGTAVPAANNLNILGGTGITTSGSGSTVTITNTSAFTWNQNTTGPVNMATNNGYIASGGSTITYNLPATANVGDTIRIVGGGQTLSPWTVHQAAGQSIQMEEVATTVGVTGHMDANDSVDCAELVCATAGASTFWLVISSVGNINFT